MATVSAGSPHSASAQGTEARFTQTHWSVVLAAAQAGGPQADAALEELCRKYWYPLYAFVRRQGCGPPEAQDLIQGFFAHLLRRDWLAGVGPEKGKFRTFLLACLKHYLQNLRARELGPRRHPGQPILSIDALEAETRYGREPTDEQDPAKLFERRWALTLIEQVLQRLKGHCAAVGQATLFEVLCPYLTGDAERGDYAGIAAQLHMSPGAVRTAVTRLRGKFRELLREEIAHTVADSSEVDAEIAHLLGLFER